MARAVQFDSYGDLDVLHVAQVPVPTPDEGEVVVAVRAAGINPGEAAIRRGLFDDGSGGTFPSGQGSDLAGVVSAVGPGVVSPAVGDEVLGWSWRRSSQADYVQVPADQLIARPAGCTWSVSPPLRPSGPSIRSLARPWWSPARRAVSEPWWSSCWRCAGSP